LRCPFRGCAPKAEFFSKLFSRTGRGKIKVREELKPLTKYRGVDTTSATQE
jgi:hypothetical protein